MAKSVHFDCLVNLLCYLFCIIDFSNYPKYIGAQKPLTFITYNFVKTDFILLYTEVCGSV